MGQEQSRAKSAPIKFSGDLFWGDTPIQSVDRGLLNVDAWRAVDALISEATSDSSDCCSDEGDTEEEPCDRAPPGRRTEADLVADAKMYNRPWTEKEDACLLGCLRASSIDGTTGGTGTGKDSATTHRWRGVAQRMGGAGFTRGKRECRDRLRILQQERDGAGRGVAERRSVGRKVNAAAASHAGTTAPGPGVRGGGGSEGRRERRRSFEWTGSWGRSGGFS